LKPLADLGLIVCSDTMVFGHCIPFVNGNNDRPTRLICIAGDVSVQGSDTFGPINDKNRDIASFQVAPGHYDAKFFRLQFCLTFSPNTGSVNKSDTQSVMLDDTVNCIPRRPGYWRDHRPLLAHKSIEQRGLADIWPADDGDANLLMSILFSLFRC